MNKKKFSFHSVRSIIFKFLLVQGLYIHQSKAQVYIHTNENISQASQLKSINSIEIEKQPPIKKPSIPHAALEKIFSECKFNLKKMRWDLLEQDIYLKNSQLLKIEDLQKKYPYLKNQQIQCTQNKMRGL